MPSYPSKQSEFIEKSQIEFITNLQRSGQLNEMLSVVLKLEEIINDGKKNSWRNLFLHYTPDLMLEDIQEQIHKSSHAIRALLKQMLFYREKRIERSISAFKHLRISGFILISTLLTTFITQYLSNLILGWNLNWLWMFSSPVFFYFILCGIFYISYYFSVDIKFVRSFENLVKTLEGASHNLLSQMSDNLTNISQYSEELNRLQSNSSLDEEQKSSVLSVKHNLMFLSSEVAEKEFELKAKYRDRDTALQQELNQIKTDISKIKDRAEVKRVREELYSKGLTHKYEMALDSIKSIIQEAMELFKKDVKESKKMHKLLKPLTRMAERFESKGEAAWSQTDLGSLVEVIRNISIQIINHSNIGANAMGNDAKANTTGISENEANSSKSNTEEENNMTEQKPESNSYLQNIHNSTLAATAMGNNATATGTQNTNNPTASDVQALTKTIRQELQNSPSETGELATVHLDVIDAEIISSQQNPVKVQAALKALWDLVKEIAPVAGQVLEIAGKLGLKTLIG